MNSKQYAALPTNGEGTSQRGRSGIHFIGCATLLLLSLFPSPALADEFIDLVIPLRDGRFYTLRDVCAECSRKLNTTRHLDLIKDRDFELTFPIKLALIAAEQADLIRVKFEANRFVLSIPNSQDSRVRRENHRRLGQLLGIKLADWPAEKGLHLPADFDPAAQLCCSFTAWRETRRISNAFV